MTKLPPAAQAVMTAGTMGNPNVINNPVYRQCIAAALRAAADQWRNEVREQPKTEFICGIKNCVDALDDIAAELEVAGD